MCEGGFYCPDYYQRKQCSPGYYCPAKSLAQLPCTGGNYSSSLMSATCSECEQGKYSLADGKPYIECQTCSQGKYQSERGKTGCVACTDGYQDQFGQAGCKQCPAGHQRKTSAVVPLNGFINMRDYCEPCSKGWYRGLTDAACAKCPVNTYSATNGSSECTPCTGGKVTVGEGSDNAAACACPPAQFAADTGTCKPCGSCLPNEYVASECGPASDVVCMRCTACAVKQDFVVASSMCKGFAKLSSQRCSTCKVGKQCSPDSTSTDYVTLNRCYSGEISYDTTVCVEAAQYKDPMKFECSAGSYLKTFLPQDPSPSTTFVGKAYLNVNNSMVADVQFRSFGVVRIFRTESVYHPLVAVSEGSTTPVIVGAATSGAVPLMHMRLALFNASTREYVYRVTFAPVPGVRPAAVTSTFVHPLSARVLGLRQLASDDQLIASCTWDYAGRAFFVVWMDGTISRADVVAGQFVPAWSAAPSADSMLSPLWTLVHPAAVAYKDLVRHQCIAVPMHPPDVLNTTRQVQLICMFTFVRDDVIRAGGQEGNVYLSSSFGRSGAAQLFSSPFCFYLTPNACLVQLPSASDGRRRKDASRQGQTRCPVRILELVLRRLVQRGLPVDVQGCIVFRGQVCHEG